MKFSRKKLNQKTISSWVKAMGQNSVVRWWIVGLFFAFAILPIIKLLEFMPIPSWLAWLPYSKRPDRMPDWLVLALASELVTIPRFFANDLWVFGYVFPTWQRLWQYHVANFGSFVVWFIVSLLATYAFSIDTVIAGLIGTVFSVGLSMVTNFLWIWRKPKQDKAK